MSMKYVRKYYSVPAVIGGRVVYSGNEEPIKGTIVGADGCYLRIRLDGQKHAGRYHPTYKLKYL